METLARKYHGRAQFIFIYGRESHPEGLANAAAKAARLEQTPDLPLSTSWADCAKRAAFFRDAIHMTRLVLVDEYGANNVHQHFGGCELPQVNASIISVVDSRGVLIYHSANMPAAPLASFLDSYLARRSR
jgi:hypothetical protein